MAPPGEHGTRIVLAVPRNETHARLVAKGVKYIQPPAQVPWGCQAIIEDPFGNRIVLLSDKR